MEELPTEVATIGNFVLKKSNRYGKIAMEWMEWAANRKHQAIKHRLSKIEKRLGKRNLPVDGWRRRRHYLSIP